MKSAAGVLTTKTAMTMKRDCYKNKMATTTKGDLFKKGLAIREVSLRMGPDKFIFT